MPQPAESAVDVPAVRNKNSVLINHKIECKSRKRNLVRDSASFVGFLLTSFFDEIILFLECK